MVDGIKNRKQKMCKWFRVFLGIISGILFLGSVLKLLWYVFQVTESTQNNALAVEQAVVLPFDNGGSRQDLTGQESICSENTERNAAVFSETAPITINFEMLKSENEDVVGWLYCADTPINYPVVQAKDNDYYINRLWNKEKNSAGALFMDYRNSFGNMDWNTIIYGHNMKNDSMFGTLTSYREQDYFEEHRTFYFLTPDENFRIELISGFVTSADSYLYDVYLERSEQEKLVNTLISLSDYESDISSVEEHRLLTLSTCSYEYDSARYIVIGKLIPIGN